MKLNKESVDFVSSLKKKDRREISEKIWDMQLYGGDLPKSISYLKDIANSYNLKVPSQLKGLALEGFEGDIYIMKDIGSEQKDSLLLRNLRNIKKNPEMLEKIWNSEETRKRYEFLVCKAYSHASKRFYFSPTKERTFWDAFC